MLVVNTVHATILFWKYDHLRREHRQKTHLANIAEIVFSDNYWSKYIIVYIIYLVYINILVYFQWYHITFVR